MALCRLCVFSYMWPEEEAGNSPFITPEDIKDWISALQNWMSQGMTVLPHDTQVEMKPFLEWCRKRETSDG